MLKFLFYLSIVLFILCIVSGIVCVFLEVYFLIKSYK